MSRDNDRWVSDLQAAEESALADLRDVLLRNLRKALGTRRGVDESFLDDAVQDSVMRILQRLDQFEGRSRFLTWATAVAIHLAMGELRRLRWKDISLDDVIGNADSLGIGRDAPPDAQLIRKSLLAAMLELIDSDLSERQRTALLAELKGMPQDEIARHLGSNRNAVYKLTHDARKKLKAGLEAKGYTAADISTTVES